MEDADRHGYKMQPTSKRDSTIMYSDHNVKKVEHCTGQALKDLAKMARLWIQTIGAFTRSNQVWYKSQVGTGATSPYTKRD